ncbi:hypothetical protein [Fibrobacter sp. UWR2]|uniref:hypothetical protein n=1 Tax=Fibrobacter sp. UWR2 TaxID=1964352 RepID=UPI000B524B36|nr:hypothetical protein [Fibrobacter sp. UWR2]OWV02241.1 hypothetical protein B7994_03275 [Fibrobacter sp. UWR2]
MENRILIIGDELFGEQGEVASRCAEMLLCRAPSRPMQFSINAPMLLPIPQLIQRAASDIIGKKAGRIVLGLGLRDLRKEAGDGAKTAENYSNLVSELVNKTQSGIMVVTIPADFFPDARDQIDIVNERIRGLQSLYPDRVKVFDFAAHAEVFKEKQLERGKFARSLYSDDAKPTSLCITLQSLFLEDCILKEIKE